MVMKMLIKEKIPVFENLDALEIEVLSQLLKKNVEQEHFEVACVLRDRIKTVRRNMKSKLI
jgi:protein-arginine kinase activator protein McsA